jgi:hypothetical protein
VATEAIAARRRQFWWIALVALVVLPFLPEIAVLGISAIADLSGCHVDAPPMVRADSQVPPDPWMIAKGFAPPPGLESGPRGNLCTIGPLPPVSDMIRLALGTGLFVGGSFSSGLVVIWLALCYVAITRGFAGLLTRMTLAFLVCLIFAFLPYFGPMISLAHLQHQNCQPNEAGAGPCILYGDDVGSLAHDNVVLGWRAFIAAPMAVAVFVCYAIFLFIWLLVSRKAADRAA